MDGEFAMGCCYVNIGSARMSVVSRSADGLRRRVEAARRGAKPQAAVDSRRTKLDTWKRPR